MSAPASWGLATAAKKPWTLAFVGPLTGPLQERTEAYLDGVTAAAGVWSGSDALEGRALEVVAIDDRDDPDGYRKVSAAVRKARPLAIAAAPSGRCLAALTKLARKRKVPLLLLTPWEPRYSLDRKDPIVHLSAGHVDHATWAADYATIPIEAAKAAALHDGSAAARDLAAAFQRNLSMHTHAGGVHAIPDDCAALLADLRRKEQVDLVFVCADAGAARRVAEAAGEGAPALLFMDGLATPGLVKAAPASARWLEGAIPLAERAIVGPYRRRRAKAAEPASPLAERGYAAVTILARGVRANEGKERGLVARVRGVPDREWRNTPVCTEWGQAKLFQYYLYQRGEEGAPARHPPLYLWSHAGGRLLRHRDPRRHVADPEGIVVVLTWGNEKTATIDEDLKRLRLHTGGYEGQVDAWVKDDLLARCLAYVNKLYWRNADGTPIPGVSFDISFGLEAPKGAKGHKVWVVTIAGDDKEAGGRAFPPNRAFTFSTFLERTMYRKHALTPKLGTPDVKYFIGRYAWGTSAEQNLRHDSIRSLINGYAGAMALTTAHECGHLCGLGHDTVTKRSIMNVVDAKGLDPESGEWVPDHLEVLDRFLGREPEPKGR